MNYYKENYTGTSSHVSSSYPVSPTKVAYSPYYEEEIKAIIKEKNELKKYLYQEQKKNFDLIDHVRILQKRNAELEKEIVLLTDRIEKLNSFNRFNILEIKND